MRDLSTNRDLLAINSATVKLWTLEQLVEGCARAGISAIAPWRDIVQAAPSTWPHIEDINNQILTGEMYLALKAAKKPAKKPAKKAPAKKPAKKSPAKKPAKRPVEDELDDDIPF